MSVTTKEREAMLERYHAVDVWLTWVYDTTNDRKATQAFTQQLLKAADPRVRRVMAFTLALDKQAVMFMMTYQRN